MGGEKFRAAHHIPKIKLLLQSGRYHRFHELKEIVFGLQRQSCVIDAADIDLVVHKSEVVTLRTKGFYPGLASAVPPSGI